MLSVVALIAVAGSQGQADTVTVSMKAAPVAQVVAKIAEVAQTKLEVAPVMLPEIILVDVKDVPLESLLNKIATVTSGEWTQDGDVRRLIPATGIRNREVSDEANQRLIDFRTAMAERIKQEAEMRKEMEMPNYVSDDSVITQLLQKADVSAITNLEPEGRVVFSSQPTSMQLPLPANASTIINSFVATHNKMLENMPDDVDDAAPDPDIPDFMKDMMPDTNKKIGAIQKALLVVSKQNTYLMDSLQAELRFYDAKGVVMYRGTSYLSMSGPMSSYMSSSDGEEAEKKPDPDAKKEIELSPESKELAKADNLFTGEADGSQMTPAVRNMMAHPEKFDPLSFAVTDMVRAIGKDAKRPVVASIPDAAANALTFVSASAITLKDAKALVGEDGTMRVVADNEFLLIRPKSPAQARKERLDRGALRALIAASEDHRVVNLDDMANYAMRAPNPMTAGFAQSYVSRIPGAFGLMAGGADSWDALRLFGKLSPQQRQTLANGGQIPFAMLPVGAGQDLSRMIFGAQSRLQVEDAKSKADEYQLPGLFRMMGMLGGSGKDYRTEPTEILPNGTRGQGFLTAKVTTEPMILTDLGALSNRGTTGMDFVLGLDELAMLEMVRQDPKLTAATEEIPQIKDAILGQRTIWNLKIQVASDVSLQAALNDNRLPSGAKKTTYNSLGSNFQTQLQARVTAFKASPIGKMMSSMGNMMGGQQAPPPR